MKAVQKLTIDVGPFPPNIEELVVTILLSIGRAISRLLPNVEELVVTIHLSIAQKLTIDVGPIPPNIEELVVTIHLSIGKAIGLPRVNIKEADSRMTVASDGLMCNIIPLNMKLLQKSTIDVGPLRPNVEELVVTIHLSIGKAISPPHVNIKEAHSRITVVSDSLMYNIISLNETPSKSKDQRRSPSPEYRRSRISNRGRVRRSHVAYKTPVQIKPSRGRGRAVQRKPSRGRGRARGRGSPSYLSPGGHGRGSRMTRSNSHQEHSIDSRDIDIRNLQERVRSKLSRGNGRIKPHTSNKLPESKTHSSQSRSKSNTADIGRSSENLSTDSSVSRFLKGFVFMANNQTEADCLELSLFGRQRFQWEDVRRIDENTAIFLLNFDRPKKLHGIFVLDGKPQCDIDANAFGGKFPAQVRVRRVENLMTTKSSICTEFYRGPLSKRRTDKIISELRKSGIIVPGVENQKLVKDDSDHSSLPSTDSIPTSAKIYPVDKCGSCLKIAEVHVFPNGKKVCKTCLDFLQDLQCSKKKCSRFAVHEKNGKRYCNLCSPIVASTSIVARREMEDQKPHNTVSRWKISLQRSCRPKSNLQKSSTVNLGSQESKPATFHEITDMPNYLQ